jgi:hypothetical protein
MSKKIELVFLTRQKTIVLPKVKPTMAQSVHVVVIVKYNEPRLN